MESICWLNSSVASLLSIGKQSGLVIEMGYSETIVLPVYEGRALIPCIKFSSFSSKTIDQQITTLLATSEIENDPESIEDLKIRLFQTTETEEKILNLIKNLFSNDQIPTIEKTLGDWWREVTKSFYDLQSEESVPFLLLQSLLKCNIDIRKELASSILFTGGNSHVIETTDFLHELQRLLSSEDRFQSLGPLYKLLDIIDHSHQPILMPWIGASLIGSLELKFDEITREKWIEMNGVAKDWSSISHYINQE